MSPIKTDLSSLNEKQKQAVISEDKRLLVLAGAGSGKTKTLLQKIIYLIEEKRVSPSEILAITFAKAAVNEMIDRLIISAEKTGEYLEMITDKNKGATQKSSERYRFKKKHKWINALPVKTFHGFCYNVMRDYGVSEFDNKFKIIKDVNTSGDEFEASTARETSVGVIQKILIEKCQNTTYLLDLKRYLIDYMVDHIYNEAYSGPSSKPYKKYYTSLNGTKVGSKSEQYIADWLYRHNIKFEYEKRVNFADFDFSPDFYIPEANLYIEHISNRSYPMKDKIAQFKKAGKTLEITTEEQTKDTTTFNLTLEKIIKNRLPSHYQFTSALSYEDEFKHYHKEIKEFIRTTIRVMNMVKVDDLSPEAILEKAQKDQHERVRDFYKLAVPLLKQYRHYCTNKSYLDYNDLICKTISLFTDRREIADKYRKDFRYILVDEFQDVNNLQVTLIKLLLTDNTRLFCVGDDWQSIYGFRGSNVDYIVNFHQHFKNAKTIELNLNYRSTQHIVGASNEVIKHNTFKVDKKVRASKRSNRKIHIYEGKDRDENIEYAISQIHILQREKGYTKEDILFLYRRNKMYYPYFEKFKEEKIFVSGKTIHGAKGLEAKAVFIIGLTKGKGGFPDIWLEDRIYQVVKESKYDMLLEEERRLFYVALTRAKDELFLLTEKGNPSGFLKEIPDDFTFTSSMPFKSVVEAVTLCPGCHISVEEGYRFCPHCGSEQK